MRAIVLLVVPGLAGPAVAGAEPEPPPLPAFLKPETRLEKAFPQRATVGKVAPALSYTPSGAKVAEADRFSGLIVIEEEGDRVRVAADGPIVRVAYYADPAALPIVARKGAVITATAEAAGRKVTATSPGVRLRAGTEIGVVEAPRGGAAKVRLPQSVLLSVEGFLPEAAFGRGFVPEKPWRQRKPQVEIRAPVDVLEAPGGAKLASLLMDLDGIRLGAAKDGHVLVRLDVAMELVVIGWVKRDAIRPLMKRLAGVIGGVTGPGVRAQKLYQGPSHAPELKRGEILYDAPDGQPVAVVLVTATHEPTGKAPAGWTQFTLPGPWGEAVLYRRQR